MQTHSASRMLLAGVILELTLATAIIHYGLGSAHFVLNALGYLGLAGAYLGAAALPMPIVRRYGWVPRVALASFASVTIVAYLVIGPYFTLGWVTKGIEVAIIMLVLVDLLMGADAGRPARRPSRSA